MKKVLTAGGIVVDQDNILLIRHKAGGLAIPKGHIEDGESAEEAALREVAEETGCSAIITDYIGSLKRLSTEETGEKVNKIIEVYKMSLISKLDVNPDENPYWIKLDSALNNMQFDEEADFLRQYMGLLK